MLVTAAAVWEPKPLEEVTADDVRRQFEINTLGTFLCCQRAGLIMVEQPEGGAIVTIGDWAIARPYPNYAAYFASKGAIPTLTRTLAVELAAAQSGGARQLHPARPGDGARESLGARGEGRRGRHAAEAPRAGRRTSPRPSLFLVENDYVTGVCLPVDGGRTIAGNCDSGK